MSSSTHPKWSWCQTTNRVKKFQLARPTETVFWKPDNRTRRWSVSTVIQRTAHFRSLSSRSTLKVLWNVSSQSKTWWVLLPVWPAGVSWPSVPLLPLSSWGLPIKLELLVLDIIILKWLARIQGAALERTDPVRWLWRIWHFSVHFPMASFWSLPMQFQQKKLLNLLPTTTKDLPSFALLVLTSTFSSKTMKPSNSARVIFIWFR